MPWATDTNRKRLRSYGDVFKNAAIRAGLYIDADGNKLYVEARGNNIRGFKRTQAYWDEDTLELRLIEPSQADQDILDQAILEHVQEHPGQHTTAIAETLGKRPERIRKALKRLSAHGTAQKLQIKTSRELGRPGTGHYWFPLNHAPSEPSQLFGTPRDAPAAQANEGAETSQASHPRRGDGLADVPPEAHPNVDTTDNNNHDDDIPF